LLCVARHVYLNRQQHCAVGSYPRHSHLLSLSLHLSLSLSGGIDALKEDDDTGLLSFDTLDLNRVLQHGAPLLASGGSEFDIPLGDSGDIKQRLLLQRQKLEKRAGLSEFDMTADLVQEDDLIQYPAETPEQTRARLYVFDPSHMCQLSVEWHFNRHCRLEEEEARARALEVTAALANTKMSARERNRAKRKAKEAAKAAQQQQYVLHLI
jgi:TATA-binding protein-associated factor